MKKILTAVVAALTLTTGVIAQPAQTQKLPEFLQGKRVVQMSEGEMESIQGEAWYNNIEDLKSVATKGGKIAWAGFKNTTMITLKLLFLYPGKAE